MSFLPFFLLSTLYVQAEKYDFEDAIPSSIQTTEGNRISLSTTYYKEGRKSLEWDYQPQSYLIFMFPYSSILPQCRTMALRYGFTMKFLKRTPCALNSWMKKEPYSSNSVSIWPPPDGELAG